MKIDKYSLYINGVLYEKFATLNEVDNFLFDKMLDNRDDIDIRVVRIDRGH